jgi:hypothetical protein
VLPRELGVHVDETTARHEVLRDDVRVLRGQTRQRAADVRREFLARDVVGQPRPGRTGRTLGARAVATRTDGSPVATRRTFVTARGAATAGTAFLAAWTLITLRTASAPRTLIAVTTEGRTVTVTTGTVVTWRAATPEGAFTVTRGTLIAVPTGGSLTAVVVAETAALRALRAERAVPVAAGALVTSRTSTADGPAGVTLRTVIALRALVTLRTPAAEGTARVTLRTLFTVTSERPAAVTTRPVVALWTFVTRRTLIAVAAEGRTFTIATRSVLTLGTTPTVGPLTVTLRTLIAVTAGTLVVAGVVALRSVRTTRAVADGSARTLVVAGGRPAGPVAPVPSFRALGTSFARRGATSTRTTGGRPEPTTRAGCASACAALTAAGWTPVAAVATSCTRFSHADLPPARALRGVLVTVHVELETPSGPASHGARWTCVWGATPKDCSPHVTHFEE